MVESADPKHWAYVAPEKPVPGEDGDAEVLRESLSGQVDGECAEGEDENIDHDMSVADGVEEDGQEDLRVAEEECRDAILEMLDSVEPSVGLPTTGETSAPKILPVVEYMGKAIFKSTLVAELNGNPFLSKDRLTRIKNFVYFNNDEDYMSAANSKTTALLGLGTDCEVLFKQSSTLGQSSGVRAAQKRNRYSAKVGRPTAVSGGVDIGTWWLGRVQKIRRKLGTKWGLCRNPVDLFSQNTVGKKVSSSQNIQIMLNWFKSAPGRNKFKYDVTDT